MVLMSGITKEELADLVSQSVAQAISERRTEVAAAAPPILSHTCFCADATERKQHADEHEALRAVLKIFVRLENARWKLWLIVFGLIVSAACLAAWEGVKSCVKG